MQGGRRKNIIGIIDYGMGNLRSVSKAVEHLGGAVYVGDDRRRMLNAEKLIVPGVGAFGDAMRELEKRRLVSVIKSAVDSGKPLLGICLGLQIFFEKSEESPNQRGLGIWKGTVKRFPKAANRLGALKIPHMGWNRVRFNQPTPMTQKVADNSFFYFVHSYYADPEDRTLIAGETEYGLPFPSVLASQCVFGVQFHPEKSQRAGLQILKNFIGFKDVDHSSN